MGYKIPNYHTFTAQSPKNQEPGSPKNSEDLSATQPLAQKSLGLKEK